MEDDRVRGRTGARMAAATLVAYWGLAGAGFLLRAINDPAVDVADELTARIGWGAFPTVGAVIVARQPHNRVGWLCCAVGFLLGPAFIGQDYAWYALLHEPGLPGRVGDGVAGPVAVVDRGGAALVSVAAVPQWAPGVAALAAGRVGARGRHRCPLGLGPRLRRGRLRRSAWRG
jgi:hypothetical protein